MQFTARKQRVRSVELVEFEAAHQEKGENARRARLFYHLTRCTAQYKANKAI